ncbi:MAG: dethiobiotin synthase [Candidatus Melainabacteria bacterium]|nr:dethiobiotin synthase [Candidatus Melainabacteria bacterium]
MIFEQKTIFITGTDTGVGKSIFTAMLALFYLVGGKKIAISKPVQTGSPKDTDFLTSLTGNKIPVFNTYSFSLGAAPSLSSKIENEIIEKNKIIADIRKLENEFDVVIVEGIGGIAVPITDSVSPCNDTYLVADLIKDLNYPIVIVARPTLGTINHTVLTMEFAKQKNLNVLGFVISGYDEKINDPVIKTAPDIISEITGLKCLMKIPVIKKVNYESILAVANGSFSSNAPNCLANV